MEFKSILENVKEGGKKVVNTVATSIKENPKAAIAIAAGTVVVTGVTAYVVKKRKKSEETK